MTGTDGISSLNSLLGALKVSAPLVGKTEEGTGSAVVLGQDLGLGTQDQASLSTAGGLAAASAADSDVRLDKVSALQQQIASGTYQVPASQVADKLLESLLGGR